MSIEAYLDGINLQNWQKKSEEMDEWPFWDIVFNFRKLVNRVTRGSKKNPENARAIVRILFTNKRWSSYLSTPDNIMPYYKNKLMPYWDRDFT